MSEATTDRVELARRQAETLNELAATRAQREAVAAVRDGLIVTGHALGLTWAELAEAAGLSESRIGQILKAAGAIGPKEES